MSSQGFLLPGDNVSPHWLPIPTNPSVSLKLGPGLRHIPPDTITPVVAGEVCVDAKRNAIWMEHNGGRYVPAVGDTVLAVIHHSSTDFYHCMITPHAPFAMLPQLSFPSATKKTRPMLGSGSLVYARVSLANKHMDPELECVHPSTGKADGLGELKGGMLFDISLGMARRLMMPQPARQGGIIVLQELAETVPFEMAVGRNGRVWIEAGNVRATVAVGRALIDVDQHQMGVDEQKKLAVKLRKAL
ncbi:MAG: exosome non-catalytic core subunit rrp40 [Thelocarpon superellum]|nr:MAG: exosome non-catalytic core subunit rrp40 [Thelocarpon superellum]